MRRTKSEDFKKELDLINRQLKQYTEELALVPGGADSGLVKIILDLNNKKAAIKGEKEVVDSEITTLTSKYNDLKTKYSA